MKNFRYLAATITLTALVLLVGQETIRASPAAYPPLAIYVSYADTEGRAPDSGNCSDCFPSPWCGQAGRNTFGIFTISFVGSSTNYNGNPTDLSNCKGGGWDTAAILLVNTGTTAITLTNLTVVLPLPASGYLGTPMCPAPMRPITFDLWFGQKYYFNDVSRPAYLGSPVTVQPGGEIIFAGTSSDGSYTCPTGNYPSAPPIATYDFDTSDANFLSGCTPSTDTVSDPQVSITVTGYALATYIDKGHTLDTGGIDSGNCEHTTVDPQWGHESLGWRPIDSLCGESCPLNQITPDITTATPVAVPSQTSSAFSASSLSSTVTPTNLCCTSSESSEVTSTTVVGVGALAVVIISAGYVLTRWRRPRTG